MWQEIISRWREKLSVLNDQMLEKYQGESNLSFSQLRALLQGEMGGQFYPLKKLEAGEIRNWLKEAGVVGVDGSVNTIGSTFPHYITLFQALAKSTLKGQGEVIEQDFHTPLLREERQKMVAQAKEEEVPLSLIQEQIKGIRLAELELKVAYKALESFNPRLIIFDGPLWRYQKKCPNLWPEFLALVQKKETYIVGVIEEVSSALLAPLLGDFLPNAMQDFYDRDLLFGLLKKGEALLLENQELKEGFLTCYLRPSSDPQVVAFDFLQEQRTEITLLTDLLFTLTPQEGRGIPLWLDIVDKEVRITKQLIDSLLSSSLSPELINKLVLPQRLKRIY